MAWYESGYTDHEIGKKLNRWCTTIRRFLFKYYLAGSFKRKQGSGRRRKTTAREDRLIIREVRKNRKVTAAEIKRNFKLDVDERTVLRRIHSIGKFKSYWSVKKPFISESNRKKRLQWAKQYQNWTIEQWKNVLWSDESPFCLRFSGRSRVWRLHNERYDPLVTQPTVKHDKKVNVWVCFTSSGVGRLYKIPGIMDSKMYKQILIHQLIPSTNELFKDKSWVFQQDNDPKHTANNVKNDLKNKKLVVLSWPAQSPDLNPIENLWSILDHGIKTRAPKNEEELFQILQNQWKNISGELLQSLVESMPRRCKAVIKSHGFATKY